jgi:signal transduction histidine kinase
VGPAGKALARLQLHWADGLVAGALFAVMGAQFLFTRHLLRGERPATPVTWLLAVALCAPLLTHRQFPRASLTVCLAALLAYATGRYVAFPLLVIVAITVGITLHSQRTIALGALIASAAVSAVAITMQPPPVSSGTVVAVSETMIVVAWVIADNARVGRERVAWHRAKAEQADRDRVEQARQAVTAERLRIARELHDVVAHAMSVIAVQSAVGGHVIDAQPGVARQALAAIESTSRSALTEMRRLLGVLRQEGEPQDALSPTPGLADVSSLVGQLQEAGLRVWVQVTGQRTALPPSVDLSAYRVVQEALTNVIKHAASAPADVTIDYAADAVTVEISNGPARPAAGARAARAIGGTGNGIIGMRERVAVFGGELTAGPRPEGGFLVRARFPVETVPS